VNRETRQDKYAIFLGGDRLGRRLNTLYKDLVPADEIMATLRPLLLDFRCQRLPGETLGDYFVRTSG
jgi:sulfite reductase (ferredoxin)